MFCWTRSGGVDLVPNMGPGDLSKVDILRGIVTEKLSTAAQEILAVVERTVSGYEEELSRQSRQLELLLQPRVKLERRAMTPELDAHDVVVLGVGEQEEHTQKPVVDDSGTMDFIWYADDDEDDDDEEEVGKVVAEKQSVQLALSSRQKRVAEQDPDYQIPSRSGSSRARSDRRKPGRPRISETQNRVELKIRILEDSHTDVLSRRVFKKSPAQQMLCPRGLQETDFLHLLRSTFPQLAGEKPFEVFTSDRSRRLCPLRVNALTPEEIQSSIKAAGAGNSSLYIRLKSGEAPQTSGDGPPPLQRQDGDATPGDSQSQQTETEQGERRRRGRPRLGEESTDHFLKVCVLEGSQVLSKQVLMRSPVQHLRCPRSLQEPDFLDLLRSTFPQLAGDKPFDVFKSDRSRKLQKLNVKILTPEEIYRTIKSTGVEKTLLYIRLKTGEEDEEEELQLLPGNSDATDDAPSIVAMEIKSDESGHSSSPEDVFGNSSSASQRTTDTDDEEDVDEVVHLHKIQDHRLPPPPSGRTLKPYLLQGQRKAACKVCGACYKILGGLIRHALSHADASQCGVCGERLDGAEELRTHVKNHQETHDCSQCGKSFSSPASLQHHATLHTGDRPFKCGVCGRSFARASSLRVHHWTHVADKPHKCDLCPRAFGLKAQLKAHVRMHAAHPDRLQCNVCGKSLYDLRSLRRHKVTHSGERRYGCEVCGKRFKLPSTLKAHEKIHTVRERPYLCDVCCKTFVSNSSLRMHMKTHSGERPFVCDVCSKGFISNGMLRAHAAVHTDEAPYGCSECGRFFKRKTHLNNHVKGHLGIKQFVCAVCGKACARPEHLRVHMRTHNGERPYQCSLCDKAFTQSHCLKAHLRSHREEETPFPGPPTP